LDGARLLLLFLKIRKVDLWLASEHFGRVDGGDGAVGPDDDDPGRAYRRWSDAEWASLGGSYLRCVDTGWVRLSQADLGADSLGRARLG
jgi:hypothetical protein